jgi:hypothetical protein
MLERLLDAEASEHGTLTEEIELICTMTGFRRRFLIHHLGEGFFRSVELQRLAVKLAHQTLCGRIEVTRQTRL